MIQAAIIIDGLSITWLAAMGLLTAYAMRHEDTSPFWQSWMIETRDLFRIPPKNYNLTTRQPYFDKLQVQEAQEMTIDAEQSEYKFSVLPEQIAAYSDWIEQARKAARAHAKQHGSVSSDDIWDICPPPTKADPRVMGAVFHPRKAWKQVEYVKSRRKANHGRVISVWTPA